MASCTEEIVKKISSLEPGEIKGCLCMYGIWFGRPLDNMHRCMKAECEGEKLILRFDKDETLEIWEPENYSINKVNDIRGGYGFGIEDAQRVIWSWYYYGREKTPENLKKKEYKLVDGMIEYRDGLTGAYGRMDKRESAVQLL